MSRWIGQVLTFFGKPRRVEFDYRDRQGLHHGSCYVSCLFGSQQQVVKLMHSFGYRNIHIA